MVICVKFLIQVHDCFKSNAIKSYLVLGCNPVQSLGTSPGPTSDLFPCSSESSAVVPAPSSSLQTLHVKESRSNGNCKKVSSLSNTQNVFSLGLHDLTCPQKNRDVSQFSNIRLVDLIIEYRIGCAIIGSYVLELKPSGVQNTTQNNVGSEWSVKRAHFIAVHTGLGFSSYTKLFGHHALLFFAAISVNSRAQTWP